MDTNKLKTQQDVISLLDSIDVLELGISRILVNFDKEFCRKNAKTNDETYIEEFCVSTVSDYGDKLKNQTIVTNNLI